MNWDLDQIKHIVVLGAGESGTGAAILAKKKGYSVLVSDRGTIAENYKICLEGYGIPYEEGIHSEEVILEQADLVIKSPGIPSRVDLVQQLLAKGCPVIDELEWASYFTKAQIIGITGSNGKTTTTRLLHHLLQKGGLNVGLAGNVGYSLAKQVALDDKDLYVVEISSFQLDGIKHFNPDVSILLNITPDHLDRYEYSLDKYIASKFRIQKNHSSDNLLIFNEDDENIERGFKQFTPNCSSQLVKVSMNQISLNDAMFSIAAVQVPKKEMALKGRHNCFNAHCAVLAALHYKVAPEFIVEGLKDFENEAHRLESVITIKGIEYINDSKATNVDATFYALDAMTKPVVWIVGGKDKGNDYEPLFSLIREKVKAIVCLGADNEKPMKELGAVHDIIVDTASVQEAIKVASLYADSGDVVLLSPACASFDLFKNYRDRGNQFKEILVEQDRILREGVSVSMKIKIEKKK